MRECCRFNLHTAVTAFYHLKLAPLLVGSLHLVGFSSVCLAAAAAMLCIWAPQSQTGPQSRLLPPKVERPAAPLSPLHPSNFGQSPDNRCHHMPKQAVSQLHMVTLLEREPSFFTLSFKAGAYLLLGPAGLLEHHPGDVGSLRVGHGGFGQVALLEARLALTAQQSEATESRPRRRSALLLRSAAAQQQAQSARSADRSRVWKECASAASHPSLLLCMTSDLTQNISRISANRSRVWRECASAASHPLLPLAMHDLSSLGIFTWAVDACWLG